jgi:hypothetical protein
MEEYSPPNQADKSRRMIMARVRDIELHEVPEDVQPT